MVTEPITVVLHEHITDTLLLMSLLFLWFRLWLTHNIGDNLLQILVVELLLLALLLLIRLGRLGWRREEVCSRSRDSIRCLLHLGIHSLPRFVLEDT